MRELAVSLQRGVAVRGAGNRREKRRTSSLTLGCHAEKTAHSAARGGAALGGPGTSVAWAPCRGGN